MKKYHMMRLYQVTQYQGYIKSGEKFKQMISFRTPGDDYKMEAAYSIKDTDMIIMVEKISRYLVKEIKTGIIFPIVNFKRKNSEKENSEYLYSSFSKVHTFVCSRENKLLSKEVSSSAELEEYNRIHPNVNKFKEELLGIITAGKTIFDDKIAEEKLAKEQEHQKKKDEKVSKKNEKLKVRRLKREFKQGQKEN